MMNQQPGGGVNAARLLEQIRATDFCLVETILYLDAYPDSQQALSYYRQLAGESDRLRNQYEKSFGPLTATSNRSNTSWDWVRTPWPWERVANG